MRFLVVFIVFSISNLTAQTIRINEVVSSNSQQEDEDGDTPDWLELHNYGTQNVSINNWALTDNVEDLTQWTFPDITLAPNQYLLIWASSKNRLSATDNLHTNFKISSSGETLTLADTSGTIVDQLTAVNLPPDTSIGVSKNSGDSVYYIETTPGNENSDNEFIGAIQSEVIFSNEGGLVNGPINLVLSGNIAGKEIRYTIGGDMPTETSTLYTSPIQINASTSVKAQLFSENLIPSEVYTKSYIVNANHEIDVMLLTVEPDGFFDEETGIYVFGPEDYDTDFPYRGANFWEDWERPIHFAFYEKEGNTSVEFNGGVKIHGGASRGNEQKSLSLFARSQYGDSEFGHSFFDEVNYNKFQALLLRNSGNDWLKSSMKDIMSSSLMRGSGLDFQEHTPVATYLNGEYWGLYNLREKVNEHMLASKHNIDADDITILEFNGREVEGSNVEYLQLRSYIRGTDLSIDSNFDYVEQEIDLEEYALYQASQIYFNNTDWPGNNIKYWKHPEGKWRWIMYDTDFGFRDNWSFNTLDWALAENGTGANKEWATLFFRKLVTNIGFKNMFINRYADELNTRFLPSRVNAHIDQIHSTIEPEINRHYQERWGVDPGRVIFYLNEMKTFANNRPAVAKDHLKSQFNLPAYHPLTITNPELYEGSVEVNSNLNIQEAFWSGDYFETVPIQLTAIANAGFEFSHWSGDISSTEQTISLTLVGNLEVTPNFLPTNSEETIVINEINFKSSDSFDADDWVELYNPNTTAIDISNWELKDDKDSNSFIIPAGTTIDADAYIVLVKTASDFTSVYPEITNIIGDIDFGFGGSDAVRLFDENGLLQDEVIYQSEAPWSDCADETGNTLELISPDLDNALPDSWSCINTNGSPNTINGTPVVETCPSSQIVLSTQQEVDAFSSTYDVVNCTFDQGVKIEGADITNLNGLSGLTIVNGSFDISDSPALTDLSGLSALSIVGGDLQIYNNATLDNVSGFSSLISVGGNMLVSRNEALTDLSGLSALTTIGAGLNISRNTLLSDCDIAFICDATVVADVTTIYQNTGNCIDLDTAEAACTFVPLICPSDQVVLATQQEVDDFSSIYDTANCTFDEGIIIEGADITNLNGLSGLKTVNGRLEISNNPILTDIIGLSSLSTVGGNLSISTNASLENLDGLALLTAVVGNILINKNAVLTDLNGLTQLTSVDGGLNISKNPVLSTCVIALVCDATVVAGESNIYSNIGDCVDLAAAEAACPVEPDGKPIVDAGENQIIILTTTSSAIFDGTANDPDGGTIVSFEWTQTEGPDTAILSGENTANLAVTGLITASYTFRLTVTDDQGETGFDEVVLQVQSGTGSSPIVNAGQDQNGTESSITLNGSGSDPDGGDLVFLWTQESGPNTADLSGSDTTELIASNLIVGEYLFKLTITDDENDTSFDEVIVTITDENPVLTCPSSQVVLSTQREVDDFSSIYDVANCTFNQGISIEGADITNLNGLSGIITVNGRLEISNNPILFDISGLASLGTVGGNLSISTNASLENLNGLALLTTVVGNILINKNTVLTDLNGIAQLTSVDGGINISKNPVLSNCEIALVCDANVVAGDASIYSNTGDCVDLAAAEAACSTESGSRPFITTWITDNPGVSEDNQITIHISRSNLVGPYDFTVAWGDGNSDTGVTGDITHTYDTPGVYEIAISGEFPAISFGIINGEQKDNMKLFKVNQWGSQKWSDLSGAFDGCGNLDVIALEIPDLSEINFLSHMFRGCESLVFNEIINSWDVSNVTNLEAMFSTTPFNQDISNWDVSNVTNMGAMFNNSGFNQNISNWNVSNVSTMNQMFSTTPFNQNISNWDVTNVMDMSGMFRLTPFNYDIGGWNVSNVTDMSGMFDKNSVFNQNLENWDTSKVVFMSGMFNGASSFNQNISNWDVSNVSNMFWMFKSANSFNQDLGNWNVAKVTGMSLMFDGTGLTQENYDKILLGWSTQQLQNDVIFSSGDTKYCLGEDARQKLIDDFGWTITDGGKADDCAELGIVWLEDFEDLANGAISDNGSTAWTSVRDAGTFAVSNGTFMTSGNSASPGVWTSEVIPVSGTISLSIDVDDVDNRKEPADFVNAYYVLDGGPQVLFGSVNDDISAQTFSITGLSGNTIQIIVESDVSTTNEFYIIDNITVTRDSIAPTIFNLTVDNGIGDGQYEAGTTVNISADDAPTGQEFDIWTGDVASVSDVNGQTTFITMPASNTTVTATYRDIISNPVFDLTVNNGIGDGQYEAGTIVNISADDAPSGQEFDNWTGDVVGISNVNNSSTTFTIPETNSTVTATYRNIPTDGVVWLEDFEDLANGALSDSGSTAWNSVRDAGTFAVSNGTFMTSGNSASPGVWTSEVIPVSGTISLSIDVDDADNRKEPADFVNAYYVLDGGPQVLFGSVNDDISAQTFSITGLSGTTIQIIVESDVSTTNEFYIIDNITVTTNSNGTTDYSLTVDNGSGDGQYALGTTVNISADDPPSGQEFDIWTGDVVGISDVNNPTTTFTMTGFNATVTATYRNMPANDVVWLEDFEDLANGAISDNGATAWTSLRDAGTFAVSNGTFMTSGNSASPGVWTSEVIPVSGTISLSIDVDDADNRKEPADFVNTYYVLDGGPQVLFGSVNDDISAQTFSITGLSGTTIQIIVESDVSTTNEFYLIDNVAVTTDGGSSKSFSGSPFAKNNVISNNETLETSQLENVNDNFKFSYIYPNPTSDFLGIRHADSNVEILTIKLFDLNGKLVNTYDKSKIYPVQGGLEVPIERVENGVYMIQIDFNNGEPFYYKVVVQN